MAYPQFGYPCPTVPSNLPSSQILMPGASPQSSVSTSCCETGRPIMTDPTTGQTICSCQYGTATGLLSYPRVSSLSDSVYGSAYAPQSYMPFGGDPSAFYSPLGSPYDIKDSTEAWRSLAHPTPCYPYDPTMGAAYPYGQGGLAQRKNATREATSTLKAWLQEHIKNPYPTKGEKIMLAIITKMTLTQVSTWFANARRRLKKENKMTWSPRNRTDEDGEKIDCSDDDDDTKLDDDDEKDGSEKKSNHSNDEDDFINTSNEKPPSSDKNVCDILKESRVSSISHKDVEEDNRLFKSSCSLSGTLHPKQSMDSSPLSVMRTTSPNTNCLTSDRVHNSESQKPRIWSLADVATSPGSPTSLNSRHHITQSPYHNMSKLTDSSYNATFRPWVNGVNAYSLGPLSQNPSQNVPSSATLLRPFPLSSRTEVH